MDALFELNVDIMKMFQSIGERINVDENGKKVVLLRVVIKKFFRQDLYESDVCLFATEAP